MGTDSTTLKRCGKCGESKPLELFSRDRGRADGRFPWCKVCKAASDAASHAKHRERRSAAAAARYRADPEPTKARALARYHRDPEPIKAYVLAWQRANPEKRKAITRRDAQNHRERTRETWRRRHARKLAASVIPFTLAQLAAKMAYWGNRCWICHGPQEAVDHVKPLAKGGLHVLANLRPICRACNTRKRDRWPYPTAA